jgi:hypothetical protein
MLGQVKTGKCILGQVRLCLLRIRNFRLGKVLLGQVKSRYVMLENVTSV